MNEYLQYVLDGFFYNIVDAIVLAVSLGIFIRIIAWIIPLKSWEKIKENSIALVIIWAIILIIFGVFIISGYFIPETSSI
jgi:uncharacterized membrane protein YjfL (UPF0719 family)